MAGGSAGKLFDRCFLQAARPLGEKQGFEFRAEQDAGPALSSYCKSHKRSMLRSPFSQFRLRSLESSG